LAVVVIGGAVVVVVGGGGIAQLGRVILLFPNLPEPTDKAEARN
jgi:hypothetical protein